MATRKPIWDAERILTHAHRQYCRFAARNPVAAIAAPRHGGGVLPALGVGVFRWVVADCPPLIVLTARFLLAGVVILGVAALFACGSAPPRAPAFALLGIANQAVYLKSLAASAAHRPDWLRSSSAPIQC
jgi:hypothetical protein